MNDKSAAVRHAAIHAAGLWRDRDAAAQLGHVMLTDAPPLVRAAAEAYGRLGTVADPATDLFLLGHVNRPEGDAEGVAEDRAVEHSVIYAAIESRNATAARFALDIGNARAKRAALLALDGIYDNDVVTTPKITWLTPKYFTADKPLPPEELKRLSDKGLRVANSEFFEDWKK
jgi:hypothetical protein